MTVNKKDRGNFEKTILVDTLMALGALPFPFLVAPSLLKVMKDYNEYTSENVDLKNYYDAQKKISKEKTKRQSQNQSQEAKEEKKKEKDKNRSEELIKIIITIVLGVVVLYVILRRLKR